MVGLSMNFTAGLLFVLAAVLQLMAANEICLYGN